MGFVLLFMDLIVLQSKTGRRICKGPVEASEGGSWRDGNWVRVYTSPMYCEIKG